MTRSDDQPKPEDGREARLARAGEFVLGLLEPAERAAIEREAAGDAEFRAAIAAWREHFAEFDDSAPLMMPTPDLWQKIQASIATAAQATPEDLGPRGSTSALWRRLWESLALWRPAAIAGVLASLVLAAVLAGRLAQGPDVPELVAVLAAPDGRAAAVVNAYSNGVVQLVPLDPIAVPEGRVLEVWTLQSRERGPVSLARMDQARTIKLDLKGLSRAEVGHLFEITLEPQGGSPTGRPTGPVVMKGLAATRL